MLPTHYTSLHISRLNSFKLIFPRIYQSSELSVILNYRPVFHFRLELWSFGVKTLIGEILDDSIVRQLLAQRPSKVWRGTVLGYRNSDTLDIEIQTRKVPS